MLPKELAKDVTKALGIVDRAMSSWALEASDFVPPPVAAEVQRIVSRMADIDCIAWGGYSAAERCRIIFGREEVLLEARADPSTLPSVQAVQVSGNFMFDAATHRDFLGACLGTGIERRGIGDVLVQGDQGAQILCTPEMATVLEMSLTQVRSVKTATTAVPLSELRVPTPKVQETHSVESSMRVDAIASAGFRVSRSKFAALVKAGDVRVNWLPCSKPSVEVAAGDVIACTGKGRLEVRGVTSTKKGKFAVDLVRFA